MCAMDWTKEQEEVHDRMEERLFKPWNGDPQTVPLFHYTTARGFSGIVESGEIWATHFDHMNDRRELRIGEDIVRRSAQGLLGTFPPKSPERWILEQYLQFEDRLRLTATTNVYLASLSERRDVLSQWRAYGSDGTGYSIGFSRLPIPTEERPTAQAGLYLVRCEYDTEAFGDRTREILREVAAGFAEFGRQHKNEDDLFEAVRFAALNIAYRRVAAEIPRLKDTAFSEEKEWRLVGIPLDSEREQGFVEFRTDGHSLTPYMKLPLAEKPLQAAGGADAPHHTPRMLLDSVIVGPGADPARSERAARLLLTKHGYDPEMVRVSSAPYRGVLSR
jgi:hypothetical protein